VRTALRRLHLDRPMTGRARRSDADAGEATELAIIMIAVFALMLLVLALGVRWVTAEAAQAASQRALEVAQSPGGTPTAVNAAAKRITAGLLLVSATNVHIGGAGGQVTVTVTAHSRLGGAVSTTASGPRIRFIPQQQAQAR
jgi:hypothetical protein